MSTEAGRRLFTEHVDCVGYCEIWGERDAMNAIEAEAHQQGFDAAWAESSVGVEGEIAEARATVLRELREEVVGMAFEFEDRLGPAGALVSRAAVLAAIDRILGDD